MPQAREWRTSLGDLAAPGDNVGVNLLADFLLVSGNGFEEAVEMLVDRIIVFLKGAEALGEVGPELRRVVPLEGGVVEAEAVLTVEGKAGEFLGTVVSMGRCREWLGELLAGGGEAGDRPSPVCFSASLTLGLLTGWLGPAKRPIGWMVNLAAAIAACCRDGEGAPLASETGAKRGRLGARWGRRRRGRATGGREAGQGRNGRAWGRRQLGRAASEGLAVDWLAVAKRYRGRAAVEAMVMLGGGGGGGMAAGCRALPFAQALLL